VAPVVDEAHIRDSVAKAEQLKLATHIRDSIRRETAQTDKRRRDSLAKLAAKETPKEPAPSHSRAVPRQTSSPSRPSQRSGKRASRERQAGATLYINIRWKD